MYRPQEKINGHMCGWKNKSQYGLVQSFCALAAGFEKAGGTGPQGTYSIENFKDKREHFRQFGVRKGLVFKEQCSIVLIVVFLLEFM